LVIVASPAEVKRKRYYCHNNLGRRTRCGPEEIALRISSRLTGLFLALLGFMALIASLSKQRVEDCMGPTWLS